MITFLWRSAREFMAYHKQANYRKTDLYSTLLPMSTFNVHACLSTKQMELHSLWLWTIFSLSSKNVNQQIIHLLNGLRELYKITTDFPPTLKYVDNITLRRNRRKRFIDMSIPGYVKNAMQRFQRTHLNEGC